jgi:hypothetical protein
MRVTRPISVEEWFLIYPLWLILAGCTYCSLASSSGFLYVTASLCFLLAILAPLFLFYMPLVVGGPMSLNMTTVGLILRRVTREAKSL